MRTIFLIGASGAGKTSLVRLWEAQAEKGMHFLYFDSIMSEPEWAIRDGQFPHDWQLNTTVEWCKRMAKFEGKVQTLVLDGQTRFEYIQRGCEEAEMALGDIVLVDCDAATRKERLARRGQPELDNDQMTSWAAWLRADAQKRGLRILETSGKTLGNCLSDLKLHLERSRS